MYGGQVSRNSSLRAKASKCLVSARLINCVAFNPSPVTSLVHLFIHPVVMTHVRAVCHSPPHCLACTLSHSTRSHTVSPYLVLTLSNVRSRTAPAATWYMVSPSVNVSHRFALFRMHLTVCRATGQPSVQRTVTKPRTVRRTTERTGNTHCYCSNCCCAHTVVPLLHY
jgi:hypothetical protein